MGYCIHQRTIIIHKQQSEKGGGMHCDLTHICNCILFEAPSKVHINSAIVYTTQSLPADEPELGPRPIRFLLYLPIWAAASQ